MRRYAQQPSERRQPDLLTPDCPACHGTGRQPWACEASALVNFYRLRQGLKPIRGGGTSKQIDFQICGLCRGTGRSGGLHAVRFGEPF